MIPYRRVLIKISGEALGGDDHVLDPKTFAKVADDIVALYNQGIEICLVIGGGNIYRGEEGANHYHIDRSTSDSMGMIATVINALAFQGVLENAGIPCRVMSAIPMTAVAEPYIKRRALRHINKKRIVIFAAGTGNPYFTTDTAAALRALEMECDILMKATKVGGIYSADPNKNPDAIHYKKLSYQDVISRRLNVMDLTAVALAHENNIPIIVFSLHDNDGLSEVLKGKGQSTFVE
jgi:uridylate kinase